MNIGIICAMNEEFELILKNIENKTIVKKARLEFVIGQFMEKNIVGVICGIGKVNASICTQILISEFKCTHIINTGVAGGIKDNVKFKDIVLGEDLVQHDVDVCSFGYKKGEVPNIGTYSFKCNEKLLEMAKDACEKITHDNKDLKFHIGRIVTGDQFISNTIISKELEKTFNAIACEMESASIAHTCYLNDIPFLIIRSISDNGCDIAKDDFYKFLKEASKNSYIILKEIIRNL